MKTPVKIAVPSSHPLTHADNAVEVWIVLSSFDNLALGAYVSPERAAQYILDWEQAAVNPEAKLRGEFASRDENEAMYGVFEVHAETGEQVAAANYYRMTRTYLRL